MSAVTGPISSMPGHSHAVPEGSTCDEHPDLPAVARIQGETDSFGSEMIDMCEACHKAWLAYRSSPQAVEDRTGSCDWCKTTAPLFPTRDYDEGMSGPVYQVCSDCRRRRTEDVQKELDTYEDAEVVDDFDDFDATDWDLD